MDRLQLFEYIKKTYGIEPDYPWHDCKAVLRHKDNNKWFGIVMAIQENKIGLQGNELIDIINVKAEPMLIDYLLNNKGFHPAFHMNRKNWISIRLDGSASEEELKNLIDMSFKMTEGKRNKGK